MPIPEEIFTHAGEEWGEPIASVVAKPLACDQGEGAGAGTSRRQVGKVQFGRTFRGQALCLKTHCPRLSMVVQPLVGGFSIAFD